MAPAVADPYSAYRKAKTVGGGMTDDPDQTGPAPKPSPITRLA